MVLEYIYSAEWLKKKTRYAFILGLSYSLLGIVFSIFLFPQDSGIVAVAFTSLILLPTITKIISMDEVTISENSKFRLKQLYLNHKDLYKIYFFIFLGTFVTFLFFSIVLSEEAVRYFFTQQLNIIGPTGYAGVQMDRFIGIFMNNLKVLTFCLLLSFIYGAGSIFLIIWNASVWGTIIGFLIKNISVANGFDPAFCAILTILVIMPHVIAEASSYFLSSISGAVISKATLQEERFSSRFSYILNEAMIIFVLSITLLFIGAYIESYITPILNMYIGCGALR